MTRAFASPGKYIQGPGELEHLREHTAALGEDVLVLVDAFLLAPYAPVIEKAFAGHTGRFALEAFGGQVTDAETQRILQKYPAGYGVVVGFGGGKTIDTAKIVAGHWKAATVAAPTSASTDAPTSALSIVYTETGEVSGAVFHKSNPDLVLLDTTVIANAPVRLLVSGMGDALATYFEARACLASGAPNSVGKGYGGTLAAHAIAECCYRTLLRDGPAAKRLAENKAPGLALENIIEANTLLSGLGFESTGCAGAHGLHEGLHELPETAAYFHGELVAFGTLFQLVLENRPPEELAEVAAFCLAVGLPVTLAQIGVQNPTHEALMQVANRTAESYMLKAEPFPVTPHMIYGAMLAADAYGAETLRRHLAQNKQQSV